MQGGSALRQTKAWPGLFLVLQIPISIGAGDGGILYRIVHPGGGPPIRSRRRLTVALSVLSLAAAGWTSLWWIKAGTSEEPITKHERLGDARLAIKDYKRPGSRTEANRPSSRVPIPAEEAVDLWIRGVLRLLQQDLSGVRDLERAASLAPGNANLWSDLSAGYIKRSLTDDPFDLVLALLAADHALEVNALLPEALFNRALALDHLSLLHSAAAAWNDYLRFDQGSQWAVEAQTYLVALEKARAPERWQKEIPRLSRAAERGELSAVLAAVELFPEEVREKIEEDILGFWADAMLKGDIQDANRTLKSARVLAEALSSVNGERMPAEAIYAIDEAARTNDSSRLQELVVGHQGFRLARENYRTRSLDPEKLFALSYKSFLRGKSPMDGWSLLHLSILDYERFDLKAAEEKLRLISRRRDITRYPTLLSRAYWMTGLTLILKGDPAASVVAYRTALQIADRINAREDALGIYTGLAGSYQYMGDSRETWRWIKAGLHSARDVGSIRRRHALLDGAADACLSRKQAKGALYFREEVVSLAIEAGEPAALSHALLRRAEAHTQRGDLLKARIDIEVAHKHLKEIKNPYLRQRVEADMMAALGESQVVDNPNDAYENLSRARAFHQGKANHYPLGRIYLSLGRSALASNNPGRAEEDFRQGILEYERQRRRLSEEPLSIAYFDQSRALFEEMIELKGSQTGGAEEAFDYAERARARNLLDRIGTLLPPGERVNLLKTADSIAAHEVESALPEGVALIEYSLLKDQLLAWIFRSGSMQLVRVEVSAEEVRRRVKTLQSKIMVASEDAVRTAAASLHDILIDPLVHHLDPHDVVVFVPDGEINLVPFAALFDRGRRRYLVEDHVVVVAPSATLFLAAQKRDRSLGPMRNTDILLVGNPRFRRTQAYNLLPLPWAEQETTAIASIFPGALRLVGAQATKRRFLDEIGNYEITHFAGHAVANPEFPLLSYLLLAPSDNADPGLLYVHELYSLQLKQTRLVTLAACNTANGPINSEGVLSLGRAFLGAGVPSVVSSLWSVGDRPASQFFNGFYEHLRLGTDVATSLRSAQLSMIRSGDSVAKSPRSWAAFQLLGGVSTYSAADRNE